MSKQGVNRGATLLHVLLLTLVLSSVLLTETHSRKQQTKSWALDYTVAQTDMLLNAAYSYFKENKAWPDCSSWLQQARNGWGVNVYCEYADPVSGPSIDRNNAREFLIRQYVPDDLGEVYQKRYPDTDVANSSNHAGFVYPVGFSAYTVKTNRTGGASQSVELTQLSEPGPATTDLLMCLSSETHGSFLALSGIESEINAAGTVKNAMPGLCIADIQVPPLTVRNGVLLKVVTLNSPPSPISVSYDMYRRKFGGFSGFSNYFDGTVLGITSDVLAGHWGCDFWPFNSDYKNQIDFEDGNNNANHEVRGSPIAAMVFQYCH